MVREKPRVGEGWVTMYDDIFKDIVKLAVSIAIALALAGIGIGYGLAKLFP